MAWRQIEKPCLNQCWPDSPTHICGTWGRSVKFSISVSCIDMAHICLDLVWMWLSLDLLWYCFICLSIRMHTYDNTVCWIKMTSLCAWTSSVYKWQSSNYFVGRRPMIFHLLITGNQLSIISVKARGSITLWHVCAKTLLHLYDYTVSQPNSA